MIAYAGRNWKQPIQTGFALLSLGLAISLSACGGGGSSPASANLTSAQAQPVIASFLNSPAAGSAVQVGFSPLTNITCDERGILKTTGTDICIRYNLAGGVVYNGSPNTSPDGIDYVLDIPLASDASLRTAMSNLDTVVITPTVKTPDIIVNNAQLGAAISLSFLVKTSSPVNLTGTCSIKDAAATVLTSFNLVNATPANAIDATMNAPTNTGFSLMPSQYSMDCTFTDAAGAITHNLAGVSLQVVNTNNTLPTGPTGVALVNAAALLKAPVTNNIRDINGSVCVAYTTAGTDVQDDILGLPLSVEGWNDVNGTLSGPFTLTVGSKQNCTDLSTLGGQNVTLGFKSVDSAGAKSVLVGALNTIDLNNPPAIGVLNSFDGLQSYTCGSGSCVFPTLTAPVYSDAEGDTVTKSFNDGVVVLGAGNTLTPAGLAAGTHNITVSAVDSFGANSGASQVYVITVNAAPTIAMANQTVNDNGGAGATALPAPTVTGVQAGAVYSIVVQPGGANPGANISFLTINASTGVATWSGNETTGGTITYSVTIKVTNPDGGTQSVTFILGVLDNL